MRDRHLSFILPSQRMCSGDRDYSGTCISSCQDIWSLSVFNGNLPDNLGGIAGNHRPGGNALGYDRCSGDYGPFADFNALQYGHVEAKPGLIPNLYGFRYDVLPVFLPLTPISDISLPFAPCDCVRVVIKDIATPSDQDVVSNLDPGCACDHGPAHEGIAANHNFRAVPFRYDRPFNYAAIADT